MRAQVVVDRDARFLQFGLDKTSHVPSLQATITLGGDCDIPSQCLS